MRILHSYNNPPHNGPGHGFRYSLTPILRMGRSSPPFGRETPPTWAGGVKITIEWMQRWVFLFYQCWLQNRSERQVALELGEAERGMSKVSTRKQNQRKIEWAQGPPKRPPAGAGGQQAASPPAVPKPIQSAKAVCTSVRPSFCLNVVGGPRLVGGHCGLREAHGRRWWQQLQGWA